jgi:hypothetical protein
MRIYARVGECGAELGGSGAGIKRSRVELGGSVPGL